MRGLRPRAPGIYRFLARMPRRRLPPPSHSGLWVGALVASLRSHILRPGEARITEPVVSSQSFLLPPAAVVGYKVLSLARFRWPVLRCPSLAGFEVSPEVQKGQGDSKREWIY
jgi:hypothetical protein